VNVRGSESGAFRNDITANPWVWAAAALCLALVVGAATLPGISTVLSLSPIPAAGWYLAVGASLVPLAFGGVARTVAAAGAELFEQ
jgi:Ca2+-transporting ATPase